MRKTNVCNQTDETQFQMLSTSMFCVKATTSLHNLSGRLFWEKLENFKSKPVEKEDVANSKSYWGNLMNSPLQYKAIF